jgi:putative tryptophan/tyrosine transport system substrate-binding protein
MRRRDVVALLGGAALSPLVARAQRAKAVRIGMLSPFLREIGPPAFDVFEEGLRSLGWRLGENIAFEYRWADGKAERLPSLATELVQLSVDLIFDLWGTPAALAAKNATATIPVVFCGTGDAIGVGLVTSLSRPGGNLTGVTLITESTIGKQLEFLKEVVPGLSRVGALINPTNPVYGPVLKASEAPAKALHLQLRAIEVTDAEEFDGAFAAALKDGVEGLVALRDPVIIMNRARLPALAAKYRLPTVYAVKDFAEHGGMMSFGPDIGDMYRRCAHIIDKILKGEHPADVPVEQATRFELVINLNTANALGLTVPPSLLARADEVIE